MENEVEYFAFKVNKEGSHSLPLKVEAIMKLEDPKNMKELQSWIGIVNYYREFVLNMSIVIQPLSNLLANNFEWIWTNDFAQACTEVKKLLASSKVFVR